MTAVEGRVLVVDTELHAVPTGCRAGDCLLGESRGGATGLKATCEKCLADTPEGCQSVVVAAAGDCAMLAACLLGYGWSRGRLVGPLAKTGMLATLDWRDLQGRIGITTLVKFLLAVIVIATSTIGDRGLGRFSIERAQSRRHSTYNYRRPIRHDCPLGHEGESRRPHR